MSTEDKVQTLIGMNFENFNSRSVLLQLLTNNDGDVDKTIDEIFTLNANLDQSVVPSKKLQKQDDEQDQQIKTFVIEKSNNSSSKTNEINKELKSISEQIQKENIVKAVEVIEDKKDDKINSINVNTNNNTINSNKSIGQQEQIHQRSIDSIVEKENSKEVIQDKSETNKMDDKKEIEDLAALNASLSNIDDEINSKLKPQFLIYRRNDSITTKIITEIINIKKLLQSIGINDFREVDLTHDYELAGYIKAKCGGKLTLPVVFFRDEVLGGLLQLQELNNKGELLKLVEQGKKEAELAQNPPSPDVALAPSVQASPSAADKELQLNILDKTLQLTEVALGYLNPFKWIWGKGKQNQDPSIVEFDVIQSNWYWRHQPRKLRFGAEMFFRLHPNYMDVRAAHRYNDVAKITLQDSSNFIIRYADNSSPDYIRCTPENLTKIIELMKKGNTTGKLEIEYPKEK